MKRFPSPAAAPGGAKRQMVQASQANLNISSSETEKIRACIVNPSPFKIVAWARTDSEL